MIIERRKTYKFRLYEDGVRRVSHATVVDGKNPLPLGMGSMSSRLVVIAKIRIVYL